MGSDDGMASAGVLGVIAGSRHRRGLMRVMMLAVVCIAMFSMPRGDDPVALTLESIAAYGTLGSVVDVFIPDDLRPVWMQGTGLGAWGFWLVRGWTGVALTFSTALGMGFMLHYGNNPHAGLINTFTIIISLADMLGMISTVRAAGRVKEAAGPTDDADTGADNGRSGQ